MDIKNHHQALVSQFWGLIGTSFHYLESVGKYNEAYQIKCSVQCCNSLIHSVGGGGAHRGCHGPHY